MKTKLLDRNGILKPMGMLLIILLLSVCCCSEYVFAQKSCYEDLPICYCLCIKEVTIVHTGYELPKRIVCTIEPSVDIDLMSSQLMEWENPYLSPLNMYAEKVDGKNKRKSRKNRKARITDSEKGYELGIPKAEVYLE